MLCLFLCNNILRQEYGVDFFFLEGESQQSSFGSLNFSLMAYPVCVCFDQMAYKIMLCVYIYLYFCRSDGSYAIDLTAFSKVVHNDLEGAPDVRSCSWCFLLRLWSMYQLPMQTVTGHISKRLSTHHLQNHRKSLMCLSKSKKKKSKRAFRHLEKYFDHQVLFYHVGLLDFVGVFLKKEKKLIHMSFLLSL